MGAPVRERIGRDEIPFRGMTVAMALAWLASGGAEAPRTVAAGWQWKKEDGKSVALVGENGPIWQFHYGEEATKPYFHPLALPNGAVLSEIGPPDHFWHYGLWFSWKNVNGVNYWEESEKTGKPAGLTRWSDVTGETRENGSARIALELRYHPPKESPLLEESRVIEVTPPDKNGRYTIDWHAEFTAKEAVDLQRKPLPGQQGGAGWGGYAGLVMRFSSAMQKRRASTSVGRVSFERTRYRGRAKAADYSGVVKGPDGEKHLAGVAMLDHPSNPRYPTPWYVIRGQPISFLNASFLNSRPMHLDRGETLTLRYRIIVHPGRWTLKELMEAHAAYVGAE